MKRYGHIYEEIYDIDNLKLAHMNARRGKTHYDEVKFVDNNLDNCLHDIHFMLKNKTYKTSEYTIFKKKDKGKERIIYKLPYYPDRIVHWAIMLQIENIFMSSFTDFTHASIKNKGIHSALRQLDKYLLDEQNTKYCLKVDIEKFFPSINHKILKNQLCKKFKDNYLLDLLYELIDSIEGDVGIPIGNYLSQYFANFYLTEFDNWLKHEKNIKYVIRYMDDVCILHGDKKFLHSLKREIDAFLMDKLSVLVKGNWQVFPVDIRGIDFVGYRHFRKYKLLRKSTCKTMKFKLKKLRKTTSLSRRNVCVINSYDGWLKWCNSYNLKIKYIEPLKYKEVIK